MELYHYTTEKRYDLILNTKILEPSTDTIHDAIYGVGWYFTDLPPDTCEKTLMSVCWRKTTLYQRIKYYLCLEPIGASFKYLGENVYFVPLDSDISFKVVSHGDVPECHLKPCSECSINPEKKR